MSALGNILWIILGGFLASLGYILGGLILIATIIGIPFGIQSIKLGMANLTPFGKKVVATDEAGSLVNILLNIIWVMTLGWAIALIHLTFGILLAVTIIGLPFAKQHFKLLFLALVPFGRELQ
jgi:uncharacterized membrane protein YccF (DUF307 family)